MFDLFKKSQSYLGVDVGKTSVKIVEIKRIKGQPTLVNYGYSEEALDFSNKNLQLDIAKSARLIKEICARAGIKSVNAVAALPSFSVFSSVLNLPVADKKNLDDAVMWEAKKVMPLDLEEMILDWKILEENGKETADKNGQPEEKKTNGSINNGNVKILLTGAPKTLVKKYVAIFKEAKMNLLSLETEIFSLTRSLIGADKSVVALIDLGAVNTDIAIIANGLPMFGRSLDSGGIMLTKAIGDSLQVDFRRAEQFKLDLISSQNGGGANALPAPIINAISPIVNEIRYSLNLFQQENSKQIEKIILSGGGANLPGIDNYLSGALNKKVIIGDPWARLSYPLDLKPALDEMGSKMAIAVGLALRETT